MGWTLEVAGLSDVGCVRTNNEDNFGFDKGSGIYVVCDGMGGAAAGEVASRLAVDATVAAFRRDDTSHSTVFEIGEERLRHLGEAINLANRAVFDAAADNASLRGMGSTLVALLFDSSGACSIGHVGDSRIYLVRSGTIQQLTADHSLVMEQVRRGLITLEQAKTSPQQNIILRALGAAETVQPDLANLPLQEGDLLLLCSDGLTREIEDPRLAEILGGVADLETMAHQLIDEARACGGHDNITVLLLRAHQPEHGSWISGLKKGLFHG